MELPNGITGIFDSLVNRPPEMNGSEFKKLCKDAALRKNGYLIDFIPPYFRSNYYNAYIEASGEKFYVLMNQHYPLIAFASRVELGELEFTNPPVSILDQFEPYYFILTTDILETPLTDEMILGSGLNQSEKNALRKHGVCTYGRTVFNCMN